jgi:hypothetical protein
MEASIEAAQAHGKSTKNASEQLRSRAKKFIIDHQVPESPYGAWNISLIEADEELKQDLALFLQSRGKYVKAKDIVEYLKDKDVKKKWGLTKDISLATAKRWMKKLGYRWVKKHRGLYFDGHERDDVVNYRQQHFLPAWFSLWDRMQKWGKNGNEEMLNLAPREERAVPWFNDESIFYGNDRRQSGWVHEKSSPEPYTKGEGQSEMVGEYFSPDFGYLRSLDGTECARVVWKPGKNRDGYFTNEDFMQQVDNVINILEKNYAGMKHILIFDNATIHLKHSEDALSARRMPKFTPKEGTNWGIKVTKRDENGNVIYEPNGKPAKVKIRMADTTINGQRQSLYFEEGHPHAGVFKGMAIILQERGFTNAFEIRAECKNFKCPHPEDLEA